MADARRISIEEQPMVLHPAVGAERPAFYPDHEEWKVSVVPQEYHQCQGIQQASVLLGKKQPAESAECLDVRKKAREVRRFLLVPCGGHPGCDHAKWLTLQKPNGLQTGEREVNQINETQRMPCFLDAYRSLHRERRDNDAPYGALVVTTVAQQASLDQALRNALHLGMRC